MEKIIQFGIRSAGAWRNRPSAYVVIFNDDARILVLEVNGEHHLPGGGIDEGESAEIAVAREALEEAGVKINSLDYIGQANQFFPEDLLNKQGTFYKAKLVIEDSNVSTEDDHHPIWMFPEEFIQGSSSDFQKWAVRRAVSE